ncbi:immunity protein TriTu family protein [Kumtagia ephedrae]|uniref:Uncharacterized protein n=1 Tax=Kumtagia ephedrae TaxID=2116701 RepID=A0A2P7S1M2_9HYPH|nr:hypothetical protein [Mesorhizobium ephedrae]PSJ56352.1 hypothetical protein C7I84_21015 [Mesorhizobium ephedrae]
MVASTAAMLDRWLEDNSGRLAGRFQPQRIGNWTLCDQQGIALDLDGELVMGRVTVWPEMVSEIEALAVQTEETLFCWSYMPMSTALLDEWLSGLEFHSGLGDCPAPARHRSGVV